MGSSQVIFNGKGNKNPRFVDFDEKKSTKKEKTMKLDYLQHAVEGQQRASEQLIEVLKEKHKEQVALPSMSEVVDKLHKIEVSALRNYKQIAVWFQKLLGEIDGK